MDGRRGMIAFFSVLAGFKIVTLIMVLALTTSWDTATFIASTHVHWIVTAVVLVAGPTVFWSRLVRARARRKQLITSEWHVDEESRVNH